MGKFILRWLDDHIEELFVDAAKAVGSVLVRLFRHSTGEA